MRATKYITPHSIEALLNLDRERVERPVAESALDLSKKGGQLQPRANANVTSDDSMKNTFLYQIMTDPVFFDKIRKSQMMPFQCPYCKRSFPYQGDLDDHMTVKV